MPNVRNIIASRLVRTYPFYTGCGTFANSRLVRLISGDSNEVGWGKVDGGYQVAAPLDDYVGRAIYFAGDLDPKVTWVCKRLVRHGDTVLDIGANLGLVTFVLSALVGPGGRVHAFEPIPRMQALITAAIERNAVKNVKLHRCALGSEQGTLGLSVPDDHAGKASFLAERGVARAHTIPVPVARLSDILDVERPGPVRLVKIDVEGFEPQVLEGAVEWFSRQPPDAILFELNDKRSAMRDSRTVQILEGLGYHFFALPKRFMSMRLRRIAVDDARPNDAHDFLALHKTKDSSEMHARLGAS
ncbi:MAG TPA: FkbM family methyltransferase [Burkholderiaceae bacterium]|nr:FkbM family methyltransferase [Burkholderiaceae bacterium]